MSQSNQSFFKNKIGHCQWILLVILFGILAMMPFYFLGFPSGADLNNHFRFTLPFYDEIASGNYAAGWLAESNFGFGDARFRFYPPFVYYLLCGFYYLIGDWYLATLLVFTLFSIIGGLGIYFWTRCHLSAPVSFIAAALFVFTPYHLAQFYQASLLAEFAAASLLPFAFLAVEKLTAQKSLGTAFLWIGSLGAIYSLIVTTHLPTTVIGSLTLGVFALLLTDWKENKKGLVFCACGIFLGLLSSSWFWVKMISELGWIQAGMGVSSDYYDYRNNFLFSPFALLNINTFRGSLIMALTVFVFLPSLIIWRKILGQNYPKVFRVMLILATISLLMTTDLSRPIWAIIPKLKDVQFPYRWLTIASIMICPLVALSFSVWRERINQKTLRAFHLLLLLFFIGGLAFAIYDLMIDADYLSREAFLQKITDSRGGQSFKDWLPRNAKELKDLEPLTGQVLAGTRQVSVTDWQSHQRIFSVGAGSETEAHLRSYFYPLWQAFRVDGEQKTPLKTRQADDGTLLVVIPNEAVTVEVTFIEPPRTKISWIIALLGWALTFGLLIIGIRRFLLKS